MITNCPHCNGEVTINKLWQDVVKLTEYAFVKKTCPHCNKRFSATLNKIGDNVKVTECSEEVKDESV